MPSADVLYTTKFGSSSQNMPGLGSLKFCFGSPSSFVQDDAPQAGWWQMAQQILTPIVDWLDRGFDSSRWVAISSLTPFLLQSQFFWVLWCRWGKGNY
jgi:hypothetical protein